MLSIGMHWNSCLLVFFCIQRLLRRIRHLSFRHLIIGSKTWIEVISSYFDFIQMSIDFGDLGNSENKQTKNISTFEFQICHSDFQFFKFFRVFSFGELTFSGAISILAFFHFCIKPIWLNGKCTKLHSNCPLFICSPLPSVLSVECNEHHHKPSWIGKFQYHQNDLNQKES